MRKVRSQNTKPELRVRSFLHRQGFRFRLYAHEMPGKPDIILPKYKTVIEIRGCFWHQHKGCKRANLPKSNIEFWKQKLKKNKIRDLENERKISELGWKLIILWECELKNPKTLENLPALIREKQFKKPKTEQ